MPRSYGTTNAAPYAAAPAVGAAGDTYFNTTNKTLYLSDGTQWNAITSGGGTTGGPDSYVVAGAGSSVTLTQNAFTTIPLPTSWSQATSPLPFTRNADGTMTCAVAGSYIITACVAGSGAIGAGFREALTIRINGVDMGVNTSGFGTQPYNNASVTRFLAIGDVVTIAGYIDSAGASVSAALQYASAHRVGGLVGPTGPTGPQGPDVTLVQSSFLYAFHPGNQAIGTGVTTVTTWNLASASGFTISGANLTCNQAGKYRVAVQIGSQGSAVSAYRITQLVQYSSTATVKATRNLVNPGSAASAWTTWFAEGIFDMVAGDYIQVQLQGDVASTTDNAGRNSVEITPVGGTQGPPGPDITAVMSSYFYGHLISPASIGTGGPALMGWTTDLSNNITLPSSSNVTISQTGKYLVACQVSTQTSAAGGTALTTTIVQYSSGGATKVSRATVNPLPSGASAWGTSFATAVLDCVAGDYIQVTSVGTGAASVPDPRSWIEIVPVGGTKGDVGPQGPSGGPVPVGGTVGQVITKTGTADFATGWAAGLVVSTGPYSDFNLAALQTTGVYLMTAGAANGPPGSQPLGVLTVIVYATGNISQVFQPLSTTGNNAPEWTRNMVSGSWGSWVSVSRQLVAAIYNWNNWSTNASGSGPTNTDWTCWTFTPAVAGWVEVEAMGNYGFAGATAVTAPSFGLYCNQFTDGTGAVIQSYLPCANVQGGVWGRSPGVVSLVFAVTAGTTYAIIFRGTWTGATNCYFNPYVSGKLYSNQ